MILVTGGTGLIGSHLLFQLVLKGEKVRALKRKESDTGRTKKVFSYYSQDYESLFERIEWVEGNVLDPHSLLRALNGVAYVYHTAAVVSFSENDSEEIHLNNEQGTQNMVEACLASGIKKLCHVSSIAVFDAERTGEPINEEARWKEETPHPAYSISKKISEQSVWEGIDKGLCAVIVNPALILGPGHWGHGSSLFFSAAAKGFPVCTPGGNSFVDVRDVARAMILLMEGPFHSENFILSAQSVSFTELFRAICRNLKTVGPLIQLPRWTESLAWNLIQLRNHLLPGTSAISQGALHSAYNRSDYSGQKIVQQIGFRYTPLEQTIADICAIYLQEKKKPGKSRA